MMDTSFTFLELYMKDENSRLSAAVFYGYNSIACNIFSLWYYTGHRYGVVLWWSE